MGKENVRSVTRPEYEIFVKILRKTRERLNVSQNELGRRIGYSQPIISAIEAGERRLDIVELLDILKALDVAPTEFISGLCDELAGR